MSFFATPRLSFPTLVAAAILMATAWTALGCGSSDPVRFVPGESCYWGAQFADCGGTGTPRFACTPSGECRWFTGGVVAEGHLAWPCADGRICCEHGPDATYPHEAFSLGLGSFFHSYGSEPWTRERSAVLDVVIDPQLSGELVVACERDGSAVTDVGPCRVPNTGTTETMNRHFTSASMDDTLSARFFQTDGFVGEGISLEVLFGDAADPLLGRACRYFTTDGIHISCDPEDYPSPECATVGSLRLSERPVRYQGDVSGVVVAGEVVFPSGLEVTFTVPL